MKRIRSEVKRPTDEQILQYGSVPVPVAATYLEKTATTVQWQLEDAADGKIPPIPYGHAVHSREKPGKWIYTISPGLLVAFKRGTLLFVYPGSYPKEDTCIVPKLEL